MPFALQSLLNSLLDGTFPVEQSGDFLPLFKMVMDAYSKVGDAAGAIHLRDLMREHGLPISKVGRAGCSPGLATFLMTIQEYLFIASYLTYVLSLICATHAGCLLLASPCMHQCAGGCGDPRPVRGHAAGGGRGGVG